jgi:hypothetical protein
MSGRLAVEQRILAALALLGLIHVALAALWTALALPPEALARPRELAVPLAVLLAAIAACVVHVTTRLPEFRWPRSSEPERAERGSGPWPLALLGAPSQLAWPLLR